VPLVLVVDGRASVVHGLLGVRMLVQFGEMEPDPMPVRDARKSYDPAGELAGI
jgi:hypothetical protein